MRIELAVHGRSPGGLNSKVRAAAGYADPEKVQTLFGGQGESATDQRHQCSVAFLSQCIQSSLAFIGWL